MEKSSEAQHLAKLDLLQYNDKIDKEFGPNTVGKGSEDNEQKLSKAVHVNEDGQTSHLTSKGLIFSSTCNSVLD